MERGYLEFDRDARRARLTARGVPDTTSAGFPRSLKDFDGFLSATLLRYNV